MSFPVYSDYKQAHSIWVDRIPKGWEFVELKRCSGVKGGYAFSSNSFVESGTPVIRIGDIKTDGTVSLEACKYLENQDDFSFRQYEIERGSLLMAMTGATIGKAGWYEGEKKALLNQRVGSFTFDKDKVTKRFFWYVLNSQGYQNYIRLTAFGGAQPNISDSGMVGYHSALPPLKEQTQIANFLDRETAIIDTLIEKQKRLIKLLKEKRQAVISHAVTKGHNPNAKMKDSGIEWLGEVPEHWHLTQIKYVTTQMGGGTPSKDNPEFWSGNIPWVSPKDMKVDYIDNSIDKISEQAVHLSSTKLVPINSVLIVVRGMILIHSVPAALTTREVTVNQDMKALIPSKSLSGEYLLYLLKGFRDFILDLVDSSAHGTKCLRTELFERMEITLPSIEEQIQIVEKVKEHTCKIDDLIEKSENAIALLRERRTAVISAAVTGKIDVRNAA